MGPETIGDSGDATMISGPLLRCTVLYSNNNADSIRANLFLTATSITYVPRGIVDPQPQRASSLRAQKVPPPFLNTRNQKGLLSNLAPIKLDTY